MATQVLPDGFITGPAHALVIGISSHKCGRKGEGVMLEPHEFPDLNLAHKDAEDFAKTLRNDVGFQDSSIILLRNEEATLDAIRDALEDIRRQCKSSEGQKPLVIVYFAGHGWVDPDKRHYLVPHDARRDRLYRTGLRNRELRDLLGELDTNRLVVFVDACHSGEIAEGGSRGVLGQPYDPANDFGGEGRFVIASCRPTQLSYEWEEKRNGIFTYHLVDLLKGESEDITQDAITPVHLFDSLKNRVKETAAKLKYTQEPYFAIQGGSSDDIVLAINKRNVKKRLIEIERRRDYAKAQSDSLKKKSSEQKWIVEKMVVNYVVNSRKREEERYAPFYGLLGGFIKDWLRGITSEIDVWGDYLIESYEEAGISSSGSQAQAAPAVEDQFARKPQGAPSQASAPAVSAPERPQTRRQLSADDREYIIAELEANVEYLTQAKVIRDQLRQPVSPQDFSETIEFLKKNSPDADLPILLRDAASRFAERWSRIEIASPGSLILDKKKDA
jgi:hypothetical protein